MADMQKTLDGGVVPVGPHRDDQMVCSNGKTCLRRDAFIDVKGGAHYTDEDRIDANVEIVRDFLASVDNWSCDYHTENEDYPASAAHIVDELSHAWPAPVENWLRANYEDRHGCVDFEYCMKEMVAYICDELDGGYDVELKYQSNEYAAYHGAGCCLWSMEIGECEEQISINDHAELKSLHDADELDDVLDCLDRDFCISRSCVRVLNEETGRYENVGRETYKHHDKYPTFEIYTLPGGCWHYFIPAERMKEMVDAFLADHDDYED